MNKRTILIIGGVLLVIIIAVLLITSFRKDSDDTSTGGGSLNGAPVVLEYWGLWEPESVMQPLIAKYQQTNPNVTIKYTQKSFTQYEENAYTRVKEGSVTGSPAPDILRIHNTWLSKFRPYLSPAPSNVISLSEYQQTYYPTANKDFVGTDSQIYAIPLEIDGLMLFYNKEIFEAAGFTEPPKTWDSIIETAKVLTKKDGSGKITQAGIAMGSSANIEHSADILSLLFLQNGVDVINDTNTEMNITDARAESSLEFYTDFVAVHDVWSPDMRSDLETFYTGQLAMMIAPSWRAFDILNSNSTVEFGVAPTPILGTSQVYYGSYWGEAVSRNSVNSLQAWDFVKFLSQEAQLKELYSNQSQIRAFGEPYPRQSMSNLLSSDPYLGALMTMAPNLTAWKKGEETFVNEALDTAINQVVEGGLDASEALLQAQKRINDKLATTIE